MQQSISLIGFGFFLWLLCGSKVCRHYVRWMLGSLRKRRISTVQVSPSWVPSPAKESTTDAEDTSTQQPTAGVWRAHACGVYTGDTYRLTKADRW